MPSNYAPAPQGRAVSAVYYRQCGGCGNSAGYKSWHEIYAMGWRQLLTATNTYTVCPSCVARLDKPETTQGVKTMQIKIDIERSDAWVKQQRLATGENTAQTTQVTVNPAELSREVREVLLTYHNQYTNLAYFGYSREYQPGVHFTFGRERFYCDALAPTASEAGDAILRAWLRITAKRAESERLQAEKKAEEAAKAAAAAELEQKKAEARELLADELALLVPKRELQAARRRTDTLASVLRVWEASGYKDWNTVFEEADVDPADYYEIINEESS